MCLIRPIEVNKTQETKFIFIGCPKKKHAPKEQKCKKCHVQKVATLELEIATQKQLMETMQ